METIGVVVVSIFSRFTKYWYGVTNSLNLFIEHYLCLSSRIRVIRSPIPPFLGNLSREIATV